MEKEVVHAQLAPAHSRNEEPQLFHKRRVFVTITPQYPTMNLCLESINRISFHLLPLKCV